MIVYTDSVEHGDRIVGEAGEGWSAPEPCADEGMARLLDRVYHDQADAAASGTENLVASDRRAGPYVTRRPTDLRWRHLLLVESAPGSHYDLLVDLSREAARAGRRLPDGVLLLAGSGRGFHGFRGRHWSAPTGNIHLSAHLAPPSPVEAPGISFMVLAAVSVVDAIDATPGLERRAGIKWVNDVLIDGAKVGGVLAYTNSEGGRITGAVLGVGLNVETEPDGIATPFVPHARSLRHCAPASPCTRRQVLARLIGALDRNYRRLLTGGHRELLDRYRERSLVMGRTVTICTEDSAPNALEVLGSGRVMRMNDDLGLTIDGFDAPFTKGRLILG